MRIQLIIMFALLTHSVVPRRLKKQSRYRKLRSSKKVRFGCDNKDEYGSFDTSRPC